MNSLRLFELGKLVSIVTTVTGRFFDFSDCLIDGFSHFLGDNLGILACISIEDLREFVESLSGDGRRGVKERKSLLGLV